MPIHDYVCLNCGHAMEVMHSVHSHGPAACPQCGGPMKKTLAAPSVHYKGTGWARKDRAGGGRTSQTAPKESGSSSGEATGTDSVLSPDSAPTRAPAPAADSAPSKEPD
jgi:putative FmdB family regulatory protein